MEGIFVKVAAVMNEKLKLLRGDSEELDDAMETIKSAHTIRNLKTSIPSDLNYNKLSLRCAYLYRHFTCIAIITRRMWYRFYSAETKIINWCDSLMTQRSVNVCSIGGGPATDLLGFYMFLKLNYSVSKIRFEGVILEKHLQWRDIFIPLAKLFNTNVSSVKYKYFDFFEELDQNVVDSINDAHVVSIVKFVSAVGYDRNFSQMRFEMLLRYVGDGVPVFFVDNSGGGYMKLMENAASRAKLRLIAKIEHKKMRVPLGERIAMEDWDGYFIYNPQKNPSVSAAIWMR